uniref:BRCA2 and CDKN1A-interacting protein n=1 Tax=Myxine glutinosa TaxID=7769 RepID=UPI00358DFA83
MASQRKQRVLDLPDEERNAEETEEMENEGEDEGEKNEDAESSDDSDSDSEIGLEVMVDFEAHTPLDGDIPGIKQLLRQLFLKAPIDLAELADLIVQQNYIGSVLKQAVVSGDSEDEDDGGVVFGLTTLISLANRKSLSCLEQLCSFLVSRCEAHSPPGLAARFKAVLTDASRPVGLLLSERFLNVPPQAALPLYKQLLSELADAKKFGRHCGSCYYLLLIRKTCRVTKGESQKNVCKTKTETTYLNAEEENFDELVEMKYSYPVRGEGDSCLGGRWSYDDPTMEPWRDVLLLPVTKFASAVACMAEMLAG